MPLRVFRFLIVIVSQLLIPGLCESLFLMERMLASPRVASPPELVVKPKRRRTLPRHSVQTTSQRRARTLSCLRLTEIGLSDKNLETDGSEKLPFEENARAWKGSNEQHRKKTTSLSKSKRPVNIKQVQVVPRRRSSALEKFFLGLANPSVAHLNKIEHVSVQAETDAHCVSELGSKLMKYLDSPMSLCEIKKK